MAKLFCTRRLVALPTTTQLACLPVAINMTEQRTAAIQAGVKVCWRGEQVLQLGWGWGADRAPNFCGGFSVMSGCNYRPNAVGGQNAPGGSRKTRKVCSFHGSQSLESCGKFALYPQELTMLQFSPAGDLNYPPTSWFPTGSLPVGVTRCAGAVWLGFLATGPLLILWDCFVAEQLQAADRFRVSNRSRGQVPERSRPTRETEECVA